MPPVIIRRAANKRPMTNTNIRTLLYLLPLLLLACTLTAQSAARVAMPLPEQTATASPTQTLTHFDELSATPALNICHVKTGIDAGALNLRACGGTDCPVLVVLHEGETLTQTKQEPVNGWIQVITTDGLRGWLNSKYTECEVTQ